MPGKSEEHPGGCLRGAVRYKVLCVPDWSAHCHCRSCQKRPGAAFTTWVGVKQKSFSVISGEIKICQTSSGVERGFCAECGRSLTYVAEDGWPGHVSVLAPTLDDPAIAKPSAYVFVSHQLSWIKLNDGLPRHEEI